MELDDDDIKDVTMRDVSDTSAPTDSAKNDDGSGTSKADEQTDKGAGSTGPSDIDAYQPGPATTEVLANFLIRVAATANESRDQVDLSLATAVPSFFFFF